MRFLKITFWAMLLCAAIYGWFIIFGFVSDANSKPFGIGPLPFTPVAEDSIDQDPSLTPTHEAMHEEHLKDGTAKVHGHADMNSSSELDYRMNLELRMMEIVNVFHKTLGLGEYAWILHEVMEMGGDSYMIDMSIENQRYVLWIENDRVEAASRVENQKEGCDAS